jgi:hypothetical protein
MGGRYWIVSPEDFTLQKLKVDRRGTLKTPYRSSIALAKHLTAVIPIVGPTASAFPAELRYVLSL